MPPPAPPAGKYLRRPAGPLADPGTVRALACRLFCDNAAARFFAPVHKLFCLRGNSLTRICRRYGTWTRVRDRRGRPLPPPVPGPAAPDLARPPSPCDPKTHETRAAPPPRRRHPRPGAEPAFTFRSPRLNTCVPAQYNASRRKTRHRKVDSGRTGTGKETVENPRPRVGPAQILPFCARPPHYFFAPPSRTASELPPELVRKF